MSYDESSKIWDDNQSFTAKSLAALLETSSTLGVSILYINGRADKIPYSANITEPLLIYCSMRYSNYLCMKTTKDQTCSGPVCNQQQQQQLYLQHTKPLWTHRGCWLSTVVDYNKNDYQWPLRMDNVIFPQRIYSLAHYFSIFNETYLTSTTSSDWTIYHQLRRHSAGIVSQYK